jgi:hypothetical protein
MSERFLAAVSMWLWTILSLVPMLGCIGSQVFSVAWFTFLGLEFLGFGAAAVSGFYALYGED